MTIALRIAATLLASLIVACTPVTQRPDAGSNDFDTVRLNEPIGGRVGLSVIEVVEDSRCPSGVQCIHAGTVRVRALQTGETAHILLTLREPQRLAGGWAALLQVCPSPVAGRPIARRDYRFSIFTGKTMPAADQPDPGPCPRP
jgi:hypothetical protein